MGEARRSFLDSMGTRLFVALRHSFERKSAEGAERSGARLGELAYRLDRKHRGRTISNLEVAFPDWDDTRRKTVSREVFRHFGRVLGDFLRSPARSNDEVLGSVEVVGMEHYEQAASIGKGVIAVTAHFGNWERFAHWLTATGRTITVVARDANQQGVQKAVADIRDATGISVLSRGNAAREMLVRLRHKEIIGILPDQNAEEPFVPFFGKPCGTVTGPALLHQRTGAALFPVYCVRTGVAKYRVIGLPPVDLSNTEPSAVELTARLNLALEEVVREYPEQYLWMHDRWKNARLQGLL